MSTGGAVSGSVTAEIAAATANGTVTTLDGTGAIVVPAGALWCRIKAAGAVVMGDSIGPADVDGTDWYAGREELWEAIWNTNTNSFITLPEINIDGQGSRVFVTYFS